MKSLVLLFVFAGFVAHAWAPPCGAQELRKLSLDDVASLGLKIQSDSAMA